MVSVYSQQWTENLIKMFQPLAPHIWSIFYKFRRDLPTPADENIPMLTFYILETGHKSFEFLMFSRRGWKGIMTSNGSVTDVSYNIRGNWDFLCFVGLCANVMVEMKGYIKKVRIIRLCVLYVMVRLHHWKSQNNLDCWEPKLWYIYFVLYI